MSDATFLAVMVPCALLGIFAWRLESHRGANGARNYLILTPITALAFLGVIRLMTGSLPGFFVPLIVLVTLVNASLVRFCAQCGAMQGRRSLFSSPQCRQCGGTTFVSLWVALKMGRSRGPAA